MRRLAGARDAGVVDQHVEAAEGVAHPVDDPMDLVFARDVEVPEAGLPPGVMDDFQRSSASSTSATATRAPDSAIRRQVARPMPSAPPVTSAALSEGVVARVPWVPMGAVP